MTRHALPAVPQSAPGTFTPNTVCPGAPPANSVSDAPAQRQSSHTTVLLPDHRICLSSIRGRQGGEDEHHTKQLVMFCGCRATSGRWQSPDASPSKLGGIGEGNAVSMLVHAGVQTSHRRFESLDELFFQGKNPLTGATLTGGTNAAQKPRRARGVRSGDLLQLF